MQIIEPEGTSLGVRVARFLNLLEPDHNILSITKVQAWLTTLQSLAVVGSGFVTNHMNTATTAVTLAWTGFAHVAHYWDKKQRAGNGKEMG